MHITLSIEEKEITLALVNDGQTIASRTWTDHNDLSERFFGILDEMLQAHSIAVQDLDDLKLTTNLPEGYTTARIAQTIATTFRFAKGQN